MTEKKENRDKAIKELQVFLNDELSLKWSPTSDYKKLEKLLLKTQKQIKEYQNTTK
jgi:hypothetical protein